MIRNASVSKLHARIFQNNGEWWLEDLRSANGTFVGSERLTEPAPIVPGFMFALAGYKYEVVSITDDVGDVPAPPEPAEEEAAATMRPPTVGRPPPRSFAPTDKAEAVAPKAAAAPAPARRPPPRAPAPKPAPEPEAQDEHEEGGEHEDAHQDEAEQPEASGEAGDVNAAAASVGKLLPKAIAYYMVSVPKLLFNPIGTIRKSIEEQKFDGVKGLPLIAWALPGLGTAVVVPVACALIASLVSIIRGLPSGIGALIMSIIVSAVVAVVGSVAAGFLFHPIAEFLIKLFKGE